VRAFLAIGLQFFNVDLGHLKGFQSSKALNTQIYLITNGFEGRQVFNPFFLLAGP